ncbi:MAG: hypothetical protein ACHREM_00950 [Polyangiales bacterium]
MPKIIIELDIEGDEQDALAVVNEALVMLRIEIDEHETDAGPLEVKDATCRLVRDPTKTYVCMDVDGDKADMTLTDFLDANVEGIGGDEAAKICALKLGETYKGGGGASVEWMLTVTQVGTADPESIASASTTQN